MEKALNDGVRFYRSENNVILSPGIPVSVASPNMHIPARMFKKVVRRDGRVIDV